MNAHCQTLKYQINVWNIVLDELKVNKDTRSSLDIFLVPSQPAFTCSKLTIETLDQGVK